MTIGTVYHLSKIVKNSQKTVKTAKKSPLVYQSSHVYQNSTNSVQIVKNSKNTVKQQKMTIGVPIVIRHMSTQSPPNTQSRANAATSRLHHMCLGNGHSPSPVGRADFVSTWTSMRLAPFRCRVLLHSLLPTDDSCSSSSLSTTVIKSSIFSNPIRKLSALPARTP